MTMAMTAAVESGAKAVVCASTGNTSASAAAYATAAGLKCAVLVPEGKISMGKLSQAIAHGATLLQVDGNFDNCLDIARKLGESYPVFLVNSVNPARIQGQKTGAFEIVDFARRRPGHPRAARGQRRQHHRVLEGLQGVLGAVRVRNGRHPCPPCPPRPRRCGASRPPVPPRSWPGTRSPNRTPSPPPSGSATRPPGTAPLRARDESGGLIDAVTDEEILDAHRWLSAREGVFVEPGSAAGVAGLLKKHAAGEVPSGKTIVITVTGPRPQGPPVGPAHRGRQRSAARQGLQRRRHRCGRTGTGRKVALETTAPATVGLPLIEAGQRVTVRVPATSANLGPGLRQPGPGPGTARHPDGGKPRNRRAPVRAQRRGRGHACPATPATWWSGPWTRPSRGWATGTAG